jgi:hypothetical protein
VKKKSEAAKSRGLLLTATRGKEDQSNTNAVDRPQKLHPFGFVSLLAILLRLLLPHHLFLFDLAPLCVSFTLPFSLFPQIGHP